MGKKTLLIPFIKKDAEANDLECRDGEIDLLFQKEEDGFKVVDATIACVSEGLEPYVAPKLELIAEGTYPTANIRIPLESGDSAKADLLLRGEISRVEAATSERLMQAILEKSAEALLILVTDLRRQGLFILPFRLYTMIMSADGTLTYPSPQAIALPSDYPPHPEITAYSVTSDTLTLSLRFPIRPHRLNVTAGVDMPTSHSIRTYISYPLYVPDPKEVRGSIGSVRCATGGNATGVRFSFLSLSAMKSSVAAPEKYYEMVGNSRTGYRISSKATAAPDYSVFAIFYGFTPPFPGESLMFAGQDVDADTNVLDWIADWEKSGEGYLPITLPHIYRNQNSIADTPIDNPGYEAACGIVFPCGIDKECIFPLAQAHGMKSILLTRPMALAANRGSRRNSQPVSIRKIHLEGLPDADCIALLYGSHDCRNWHLLIAFDPHATRTILTPPRFWHRLVLIGNSTVNELANCLALRLEVDYL